MIHPFDESVTNYDEMYRVIPISRLAELTRDLDKSDFARLFEVERTVNALPEVTKCVSVCLFCQKVDNQFANQHGTIDFSDRSLSWYARYVASLLRMLADFAMDADFMNWKVRIYLEPQLKCFIRELGAACDRVEICVMQCNSVGAGPGALWRFLAFDDRSLEVAFVMDIDDTLASRKRYIEPFLRGAKCFGRYMPSYKSGFLIGKAESGERALNYATVLGSMVALRPKQSDICVREVMVNYMVYRKHRASVGQHPNREFDTDIGTQYNEQIGAHIYGWGGHWFMYGFDERMLKHTLFPHFAKQGQMQTWAEFDVTRLPELAQYHPCALDFEFCRQFEGNEYWICDSSCRRVEVAPRLKQRWTAEDIAVVFLTCPRQPSYLSQSLASFYAGDPATRSLREVSVEVDAPDLECVKWLQHHVGIRFVARTPEESERVKEFSLHRKGCAAYWRAMGLASAGSRAVLVCEDDVIFRDRWLEQLLDCLNEMEDAGISEFILSVYSPYDLEEWRRGRAYSSYPAGAFFGTQGVLYPARELAPVREMIWKHGVLLAEQPYDLLMKRRAIERQHLFGSRHSLVQHVGFTTTGLGGGHHMSPSFGRDWPGEVTRLGDDCKPWMEDAEVAIVDKWLTDRLRVLEYGAGGSTVRWAHGRDWHVVEHDTEWHSRVCAELRHRRVKSKAALVHPTREIATCYVGEYPEGYLEAWEPYVHAGEKWGGRFDAVIVDGRARLACARLAARNLLAPGGVILWHDFGADGRKRYEAILAECELVERVGTLAVLRPVVLPLADVGVVMTVVEPPEKVAWALRHLRAVYPNAPAVVISDGVDYGYAEVTAKYGATYISGERLKVLDAGARWWQRAFEEGLALGTRHILKVDPDTRFNRPARHWPKEDCFGFHIGPGMVGEHIQGGVQGFQRSAVERIVKSGICLRDEFKKVAYWAFTAGEGECFERDGYLSTDRLLMRILKELGMSRTHWHEIVSHWGPAPADAERYAISHWHK